MLCIIVIYNNYYTGIEVLLYLLQTELEGPGSLLGYRAMWYRLKYKYNLSVKRYDLLCIIKIRERCAIVILLLGTQ